MSYDYRAARDWVFGIRRNPETEKVADYAPTPATMQERALLLALIEFAPNIEPSTLALSKMLGTSERQVRRLLRRCEELGLLTIQPRTGKRSEYVLTMADPGLIVLPQKGSKPRTNSPPTPDGQSSPPRTNSPPKQTTKADKKADKIPEPYRLEVLAPTDLGSGKPKTNQRAKSKRVGQKPTDNGAHAQVVAVYFEVFRAQHGRDPVFAGPEGTAVKNLLKKLKGDHAEACRRVRNAFSSFRANSVTIRDIASKPDAFASAEVPKGVGVQRGPGDADLVARMRAEGQQNT